METLHSSKHWIRRTVEFIKTDVESIETLLHQNTKFVKQLNSLKLTLKELCHEIQPR